MKPRVCLPLWLSLLVAVAPAQVHESPMAGQWYPAEAAELEVLLDRSFAVSEQRTGSALPRKELRALVAPHAGISYSGAVAASAYRLLDKPRNVILLGFSHRRLFSGVAAPAVEAFRTPLGEIPVNLELLKVLDFPSVPEERLCDHSIENHLPFLQRAAPGAGLVPLYVGDLDGAELATAARKLAWRMEQGDVVIASTDFTHYGEAYGYTPFPNDEDLPRNLMQRARVTFDLIGGLDVKEFDSFVSSTRENLCGRAPIRLLMAALAELGEDIYPSMVDYLASGELSGDHSLSVGYGALAFYPASAFAVGAEEQDKLLASARHTLNRFLAEGRKEPVVPSPEERGPDLEQYTGVFVTVRKGGKLRGCIGSPLARAPLYQEVSARTLEAAAEDPRFPPVRAAEGPFSVEISLLTPLRRVADWRRFRLGQGAVLLRGGRSALLLPQVAQEQGWTREQFLENLARKAGLSPRAYRDPNTILYVYSAQIFAEPDEAAADGAAQ